MNYTRWLLNAVALLIPVLFFVGLEGGLRLAGFGDDYPLFEPVASDSSYLYQNPQVARRYFNRQQQVPSSQRDYFEATKAPDTFRIFVQGGSSAAGYPLYYGGSFSRMLEQRLLQSFPGKNIEVINTAMAAVNSYTLLDLVDEIIEQEPDLVLIYAGHNEYYGSLGVGSAESLGRFRGLVNLYLRLQHFRVMQALQRILTAAAARLSGGDDGQPPGTTLMSRLVEEQEIPYASPIYDLGVRQFRGNMDALLRNYRRAGIPVLIGTLASNEKDQAPFVSEPVSRAAEENWRPVFQEALANLAQRDSLGALAALDEVIRLDTIQAIAYYAKGKLLFDQGNYESARAAFLKAKDRDQLRFRAPEEINEVIRELAERHDARVVDVQLALRERTLHRIIGREFMLEHLHPNVEGYFTMADAFYRAIYEEELIGPWERRVPASAARREVLLTPVDSLVGQYRVKQLMNSWPFQPAGVPAAPVDIVPRSTEEKIAFALFREEIGWYEATNRLVAHYEATGAYHDALKASLAIVQEFPFVASSYLTTAQILLQQGRIDEALNYTEAGIERERTSDGLALKGHLLHLQQESQRAVEALRESVALDGGNEQALFLLSSALMGAGQREEAEATLNRLLALNPEHPQARAVRQRLDALSD